MSVSAGCGLIDYQGSSAHHIPYTVHPNHLCSEPIYEINITLGGRFNRNNLNKNGFSSHERSS